MNTNTRLATLQCSLFRYKLDALLVSNTKNIRYLTGFTGSSGLLLVGQHSAYLVTDGRYTLQAKEEVYGAEVVIAQKSLAYLAKLIGQLEIRRLGLESQQLTVAAFQSLKDNLHKQQVMLVPKKEIVEKKRQIKDQEELDLINQAIQITAKAYEEIKKDIKPGISEQEIALKLEWAMRTQGAEAVSFETIVASGQRSALPHGRASDKLIAEGDLVVIDFGASYHGYCADVTRTLLVGGKPTKEQREIYTLVALAQRRGIEAVRPGVQVGEVDQIIRQEIEQGGYGKYFVHSSGHGLGLDVHESPRIYKTDKTVLQPGMVITIEPGIYLPHLGGVRIEDMLMVTADGCQVLTSGIPKDEFI